MRITGMRWQRLELPLAKPYVIAYETVSHATNIILELQTDAGISGYGCACPDLEVTGESPEVVLELLKEAVAPALYGADPFHYARLLEQLRPLLYGRHSTMAMVDMALLDLVSRKAGEPLYRFLGGYAEALPTSVTIGIMSPEETLQQAAEWIGSGFQILKIKGGKHLEDDVLKMRMLREQYPKILLRFDGNQGYTAATALEFVRRTKSVGIEIFEQPTLATESEALGEVTRNTELPVMADESLRSLTDAFRLAQHERVDMINIKLMKVGGILEGLRINSVGQAAQLESMVGCLDECALGIAAGLHFALSRPNICYADLDGHLDLLNDPFQGLFRIEDGMMYPAPSPGLGPVADCLGDFWETA